MQRPRKDSLLLAGATAGVVLACLIATMISRSSTWRGMDWNEDGSTSLGELFEAVDIDERTVVVDGEECIEHFSYKDGLPVRTDCPSGKRVPRVHGR
jgi:hypothetical protein